MLRLALLCLLAVAPLAPAAEPPADMIRLKPEHWRRNDGDSCAWNAADMIALHAGKPDPKLSRLAGCLTATGPTTRARAVNGVDRLATLLQERGVPCAYVDGRPHLEAVLARLRRPVAVFVGQGQMGHCTVVVGVERSGHVWLADNSDPPGVYRRLNPNDFWPDWSGLGLVVRDEPLSLSATIPIPK